MRERRLIADGRRHAAEQRGDFRAGLHEAEDVVDEEQHVGALLVAEVLGHRDAGLRDAETHARRFVHLTEHERRLREHARLFHFEPEVVAFARALADAGEHREALVHVRDVADQLLNENGLADAGAAEESDLTAARVRRHQVDDLDARLEDLRRRILLRELRCGPVNRPIRGRAFTGASLSIVLPSTLKMRPSVPSPTGTMIGPPVLRDLRAAHETVGRTHREAAHLVVAEFVLHFEDRGRATASRYRRARRRRPCASRTRSCRRRSPTCTCSASLMFGSVSMRELDVDDVPEDLNDFAGDLRQP